MTFSDLARTLLAVLDDDDRTVAVGADEVAAARELETAGLVRLTPTGRVPPRVRLELVSG